jgi:ribosomal protein L3 glutamine methyltransferase
MATKKSSPSVKPLKPTGLFADAAHELHTVRDFLRFAISRFNEADLFFGHGSQSAYDEAAYLILHTLNLPLDRLEPFMDALLLEPEKDALVTVLYQRVSTRKPAAYLTHEAWLDGQPFYVDERVIVPRSFIAELLRDQLKPWVKRAGTVENVLDLCTGSGCLAILAAHAFPNAMVDAVDISSEALDVAHINVEGHGLEGRVFPIESNMFDTLAAGKNKRRYDVIISNPPYVDAMAMDELPNEYLAEPGLALASGDDGLDHTRAILKQAKAHLNPGGVLVVEIGHNRAVLEQEFPKIEFQWPKTSGGDRFVFVLTREQL